MGVIYRLDCECGTGVVVRDRTMVEAVEKAREANPGTYVLRCPICSAELWTWAEAEPLDLGLLREGATPYQGRRP